jgi:hypothetical protein
MSNTNIDHLKVKEKVEHPGPCCFIHCNAALPGRFISGKMMEYWFVAPGISVVKTIQQRRLCNEKR